MSEEAELDSLQSVAHGALITSGGTILQRVLLFLVNLVLTSALAVGLYGVFALGFRLTMMATRFASMGGGVALVRFLPAARDDPDRRNRLLGLAYLTTLVASAALVGLVWVAAPWLNAQTIDHPAFVDALRLFAVIIPLYGVFQITANVFRSLELIEHRVAILNVGRPAARLIGGLLAVGLGYSILGIVGLTVAVVGLLAVGALVISLRRTDIRPTRPTSLSEATEFYNHALPFALSRVGGLMRNRVDVLLIGILLTESAAGIYNIALFLATFISIPLISFNQLLPPIASELHEDGDTETLNSIYTTITRLVFTGTLLIAITQFVYRTELLAIFGPEYVQGSAVFALFIGSRVVGSAVGATGWLLYMTDHQYLRMVNSWSLGMLNVVLSYYFVLQFGLIGAALGTAGSLALINLVRLGELWYLEGLQPFDRTFLKPSLAGVAMAATMLAVAPFFSGLALLTVGSLLGLLTFAAALYWLGVETVDRKLVGMLLEEYRTEGVFGTGERRLNRQASR